MVRGSAGKDLRDLPEIGSFLRPAGIDERACGVRGVRQDAVDDERRYREDRNGSACRPPGGSPESTGDPG